jgi:hypothetical protein
MHKNSGVRTCFGVSAVGFFQKFFASRRPGSMRAASRAAAPRLGAEALESRAMMAALVRTLGASQPDLAPASDSGWSAADNRTSISTPTFSGTARGGAASVNLFDGQTRIGTAPVVNGVWRFTVDPAASLPPGRHAISAQAIDRNGNFGPRSSALPVELSHFGPNRSDGRPQPAIRFRHAGGSPHECRKTSHQRRGPGRQ